jgi:hypothetical protein
VPLHEQAAGDSPDVRCLVSGDSGEGHVYSADDRLRLGIEAFLGREHNDLVLWIESRRAVVAGDTLVDFGRGARCPRADVGRVAWAVASLRRA